MRIEVIIDHQRMAKHHAEQAQAAMQSGQHARAVDQQDKAAIYSATARNRLFALIAINTPDNGNAGYHAEHSLLFLGEGKIGDNAIIDEFTKSAARNIMGRTIQRQEKNAVLRNQLAWVRHWQDDRKANLLPTEESLDLAARELEEAIKDNIAGAATLQALPPSQWPQPKETEIRNAVEYALRHERVYETAGAEDGEYEAEIHDPDSLMPFAMALLRELKIIK